MYDNYLKRTKETKHESYNFWYNHYLKRGLANLPIGGVEQAKKNAAEFAWVSVDEKSPKEQHPWFDC
ncbi:MAG: hypothetical protein WC878_06075 [Candidatus Paceibacterota bacterium]|jgi:hypothetical protein